MHKLSLLILSALLSVNTHAAMVSATLYSTAKDAKPLGEVVFVDTTHGLLIAPKLTGLTPGMHGFHLHQHADCGGAGMHAGDHFDPKQTNSHQGPYGNGHLGDLPALFVSAKGQANIPVLAPRLQTSDLIGLTLMIHEGGDNYSDTPKLGGGGTRIACGVIK